ncbi:MAG: ParB-like nuclease domain-containing protein [Akkermansia sp.]|nr:ParB-like nuclease domain-containing protein [Akkermansia sp.]
MRERFEQEQASRGVELDPQAFGSRANVTRQRSADGQQLRRVLRIAHDARVDEIAEELGEQVMYDWRESQGMSVTEAYRYLRAFADWAKQSKNAAVAKAAGKLLSLDKTHPELAERIMQDDFNEYDLSVDEYRAVERELTEAGSTLMLSELRQAAADGQMPGWARELFGMADLSLLELERDMNLAMAMEEARAEGVLPEVAQKLFGAGREAVEAALREEPEAQEYRQAWYEVQKRQGELDAAYGAGKLTEPSITEDFEARARQGQEALEREREEAEARAAEAARERLEEYAAEPENAGKSHEEVVQEAAEHAADAAEERLQGEPGAERDADFAGGLCLEITDEGGLVCKSGLLEVGKLQVLPNFKLGADADSGVVHPLKGDYRPDHDPIRVWRKADGALLVISGRHRLDAAKRAGATRISAYVYDESEVRDLAWARRYDIESNIRDNQATPLEVALYVRGEFTGGKPLSNEEVERAGITREGKLGSIGFRIGRRAGESVMDALRNGTIDDRVALWIADFCPGNDAVQRRGLEVALRDGSKAEVLARMEAELAKQQMQEEMGLDGGMDLFGNTLDNDEFMDFVAQYVLRRRNELAQDASYLNATAKKRNAEAMGKKYGVDVKDPVALKKKLAEINALRERWKNPYSDSELMDEIRRAWRGREGNDMPADAVASKAESPSERLFREYAAREWQTEGVDYSFTDDAGKRYVSDKDGNPVSYEELIRRSRAVHDALFVEVMRTASPEMREAVANIEAVLEGKLDKGFRYRDLSAEEVAFFKERTGVDFEGYEWRIIPRALLHENRRSDRGLEWNLTDTELKLLPHFIDSILDNRDTLAVSLGEVNAKGVRSFMVEVENPITKAKMVFEASSKKHTSRPYKTKKAPRLSLSSAKMLLIQRAGLPPASTPQSAPSGEATVAENGGEVKQNLLKQEFSSRDTSINSNRTPAVYGMVDKIGGWREGTVNIDIGGGKYDTLTKALADKGVTSYIYEPYGRSSNENAYILAQLQSKELQGDTATCSNVLNVIKEADVRDNVVHQVAKAIKPDGVAYFTIYEGNGKGRGAVSKNDCWQNNRKTETYVDEVRQHFGDVQMRGKLIIARNPLHAETPAEWRLGAEGGAVHFSVIGPNATTWDKYRDRMFTGRDDGMLRAEIDASQAKIKAYPKEYPVYDVMRKLIHSGVYDSDEHLVYSSLKFIEDMSETEKGDKKLNETELKEDTDRLPDLAAEVERGLKAAGLTWESDIQAVRGACFTALGKWKKKLEEELKGLNIEKPEGEAWHALVEQKPGLASVNSGKRIVSAWSGKWLDDVLDYPELFEAYPHLRNIQLAEDFGMGLADASYSEFARKHDVSIGKNKGQYPLGFINMNPTASAWSDERKATSLLLHEIQHAIQDIEGFAKGADDRNGMDAYMRSAGEIEARNVQARYGWSMDRRAAIPFNSTLEYPGEALVTHYSICGLKAKTANEYLEKGADYTDPADGQRKFVIPVSGARLRSDVTPGMLNVAAGGHKDVSLAALLHYPELYRAYPQLAEMRVRLYRPVE